MARDPGADDVVWVDHDTNKIRMVLNDTTQLTVCLSGVIAGEPLLSASTTRVSALDPAFAYVLADATAANFGIVLPTAASSLGKAVTVKKIDASANIVYLSGAGTDKVDGNAQYGIKSANASVTVVSDGINWYVASIASASLSALV